MKKAVFIVLSFSLLASSICLGQKGQKNWEHAETYFARKEYAYAIEYYKLVSGNNAHRTQALQRLVQCYNALNDGKEALYYAKLWKSKNGSDSASVLYGQVLKENGFYSEARNEFTRLSQKHPSQPSYTTLLASCDSSLWWAKTRPAFNAANIWEINTEYSEISPSLAHDSVLVFSSNREGIIIKKKSGYSGEAFYDLYQSSAGANNDWSKPSLLSSQINSVHHEFAPSFSSSADTIYFTKSIDRNKSSEDSVNRLKLYSAYKRTANTWSQPEVFILNDSLFSFAHPFMDNSGTMFFFASDMAGGYGSSDIYVCFRKDSLWSAPLNLGPVINTHANETYPFYQNGSLYFSSDKETGMGGYDIYKATQENGDWVRTQNMRPPFNSPSDDFSLSISKDGKKAFFSSNRKEGKGKEDIYMVLMK